MDCSDDFIEEREEYLMMVSQIFENEEQGYEHYNRYAKEKGFSVRKDDKEYVKGTKELKRRRFCCSKEGYSTLKVLTKRGSHGRLLVVAAKLCLRSSVFLVLVSGL